MTDAARCRERMAQGLPKFDGALRVNMKVVPGIGEMGWESNVKEQAPGKVWIE